MPSCASSSTAMEVDGPPIPVEHNHGLTIQFCTPGGEFTMGCQLEPVYPSARRSFPHAQDRPTIASVALVTNRFGEAEMKNIRLRQ